MSEDTELPPIVIGLLALKKAGQPVLLHGRDTYGREDLIKKVHLLSGGIDASWKYQGQDENINNNDDLENEIRKAEEIQDHERVEELLLNSNDTARTYRHVDCGDFQSGDEVFKELSYFEYKVSVGNGKIDGSFVEVFPLDESDYAQFINKMYVESGTKELMWRKGLLFIDNLECEHKDDKGYIKLGKNVEKRRFYDAKAGNWLVVYAYEYERFPQYFIDHFELVSLDDSEANPQKKEINKAVTVVEPPKDVTGQRPTNNEGIIKKRGRKPKKPKYGEFMKILDDILEYGEDISLGKYVKKVQAEMERKGLKEKKKNMITKQEEESLIYTDKTIKTYIQKHPKYEKIQKKREAHKKA
jgi:hypothetical protein